MDRTKQAQRFGAWMRGRRTELRLSQGEAAGAAGIDRPTWSDYERAAAPDRLPTEKTLYGIADALKTPPDEVFKRAGVPRPGIFDTPMVRAATREGEQLLENFTASVLEALSEMRAEIAELNEKVSRLDSGSDAPRKRNGLR